MREDGETCIAFIEDLIESALKGRLRFAGERRTAHTTSENETIRLEMAGVREEALRYFERHGRGEPPRKSGTFARLYTKDHWASVSDEDRERVKELARRVDHAVARIATVAHASPLVSDVDQTELRTHMRRMTAALRFREYEQWDRGVLHDEGTVLGVTQPGESENRCIEVNEAREIFEGSYEAVVRILELAVAAGEASAEHREELDEFGILYRRNVFDRDLKQLAVDAERTGDPLTLLMIDADHFKQVNDVHGHQAGDDTLKELFEIVRRRVRGKGRAYRFGGDEVVVLLPNYSAEEARALAEKIREGYELSKAGRDYGVTGSIGVACLPNHAADATALKNNSDKALYEAKEAGRNCVRVFREPDKPTS
jgi:diguanylate cyclase (GGDEF)-like protein